MMICLTGMRDEEVWVDPSLIATIHAPESHCTQIGMRVGDGVRGVATGVIQVKERPEVVRAKQCEALDAARKP